MAGKVSAAWWKVTEGYGQVNGLVTCGPGLAPESLSFYKVLAVNAALSVGYFQARKGLPSLIT